MKIKRYFNLIEVLLAMGVSAIGIAGIMGIIPIALNATRDAQADYFVANVADTMFSIIDDGMKDIKTSAQFTSFFSSNLTSTLPAAPALWLPHESGTLQGDIEIGGAENGSGATWTDTLHVRAGKKGESMADFTGDMRIWTNSSDLYIQNLGVSAKKSTSANIKQVYIEISWPAVKAYDDREKRVFVREYVDPSATLLE